MRYSVFTSTDNGIRLAKILKDKLDGQVDVYRSKTRSADYDTIAYDKMSDVIKPCFESSDCLVFFGAVGIAVRMIAPYVKSKLSDPAVIVVDEQGKFAISLLSGHVGGANDITRRVADILSALPVITTATDLHGVKSPDAISTSLGLFPYPKEYIKNINDALLHDKELCWFVDEEWKRCDFFIDKLKEYGIEAKKTSASSLKRVSGLTVFLTEHERAVSENILLLVPRALAAGVGCRRDTPKELIMSALKEATASIGQDVTAITVMASTTVKADERSLLETSRELGVEIRFFENEVLQDKITRYNLPESEFVKKQIGVGNVSASAALSCFPKGSLALGKTKFEKVTVALVWQK